MREDSVEVLADSSRLGPPALVGKLFRASTRGKEVFSFAYDDLWLKNAMTFEIDPALSLYRGRIHASANTSNFGIFLDSAPDRWGRVLMDRRELLEAREEGRTPRALGEWNYLLGVHDGSRMGALRFRHDAKGPFLNDNSLLAAPPMASLRELEQASLELEKPRASQNKNYKKWLYMLMAPGSSLGGARPKANVVDGHGQLWIAKFPSRNDRKNVGAWERLVHTLAGKAGLNLPQANHVKLGGSPHHTFLSRRFDRDKNTGRRFFVSAMTLLQRKDGEEGASYLDLAEILKTRGACPEDDRKELWRRIVFSICVSNTDDHLRNHGFILEPDGWTLSPAYDLNAIPGGRHLKLNIDEQDNTADVEVALSAAEHYALSLKEARAIAVKVQKAVKSWSREAKALAIPRGEQELMAPAFKI